MDNFENLLGELHDAIKHTVEEVTEKECEIAILVNVNNGHNEVLRTYTYMDRQKLIFILEKLLEVVSDPSKEVTEH